MEKLQRLKNAMALNKLVIKGASCCITNQFHGKSCQHMNVP